MTNRAHVAAYLEVGAAPRIHHYMNADGTCHAGDLFEHGTEYVVLYTADELVRIVNAEKAEAWAEGARAVQVEAEPWCSRSFACTRTPTNPYLPTASGERPGGGA